MAVRLASLMAPDHVFRIRGKLAFASPTKSVSPPTRISPSHTTGLRRGLRVFVLLSRRGVCGAAARRAVLPALSLRRRAIASSAAGRVMGWFPVQSGFVLPRIVLHRAIPLLLRPADAL